MRDYIDLGSAPSDEDCVQVDPKKDYLPAMRAECQRYIDLLRKKLGPEPAGARLAIRSNPHDFGTYLEVVCYYDDQDEEAAGYAFRCESDAPRTWDDTAPPPTPPKPAPGQEYMKCDRCGGLELDPKELARVRAEEDEWRKDCEHFGIAVRGISECLECDNGQMVVHVAETQETPQPSETPACPVPQQVCDSCLAVAYDNMPSTDRATATTAMTQLGLDLEDHWCTGGDCECACNLARRKRAEAVRR